VNPGLENPGYENAEINSEMNLYEVYLSGFSKNKIVFNKFVEGAKYYRIALMTDQNEAEITNLKLTI